MKLVIDVGYVGLTPSPHAGKHEYEVETPEELANKVNEVIDYPRPAYAVDFWLDGVSAYDLACATCADSWECAAEDGELESAAPMTLQIAKSFMDAARRLSQQ